MTRHIFNIGIGFPCTGKEHRPCLSPGTSGLGLTINRTAIALAVLFFLGGLQALATTAVQDSTHVQLAELQGSLSSARTIAIVALLLCIIAFGLIGFLFTTLMKKESHIRHRMRSIEHDVRSIGHTLHLNMDSKETKGKKIEGTVQSIATMKDVHELARQIEELRQALAAKPEPEKPVTPVVEAPKITEGYVGEVKGNNAVSFFNDFDTARNAASLFHIFNIKDDTAQFELLGVQSLNGHNNSKNVVDVAGKDIAQATMISSQTPGMVVRQDNMWKVTHKAKVTLA